MYKLLKIILLNHLLLFAIKIEAQTELKQADIDTLYVKALEQRFDWMLSSGYKYIDIENQSVAPQKVFRNNMIKILSQNEIIEISRKEKKEFTVYRMSYKIISKDTVDINFSEYKLKGLKRNGKNSPLAEINERKCCDRDYKPDIRFVLKENKWQIIRSKFVKN